MNEYAAHPQGPPRRTAHAAGRPAVGSEAEPLFRHSIDGAYVGNLPRFYDRVDLDAIEALEDNFDGIRREVLGLLRRRRGTFTTNFTPGEYRDTRWRTLNLNTDRIRYHRNRRLVPVTSAVCDSIPGMASAQISVLSPGCRLPLHHGDTNAMYRMHLPLVVPGSLPDVGLEVGGEARGWVLGRVLVFEDAHLHSAWNETREDRVVLVVDVLKPEFRRPARWLCARLAAGIILQSARSRFERLDAAPRWVLDALERAMAAPIAVGTEIQRRAPFLDPGTLRPAGHAEDQGPDETR